MPTRITCKIKNNQITIYNTFENGKFECSQNSTKMMVRPKINMCFSSDMPLNIRVDRSDFFLYKINVLIIIDLRNTYKIETIQKN